DLPLAEKMVGPLGRSRIFLWFVPADVQGKWTVDLPEHGGRWEFSFKQTHQMLDAEVKIANGQVVVRGARVRGKELRIDVTGVVAGKVWNHQFRGDILDGRVEGELRLTDGEVGRTIPWRAIRP